MNWSTLVNRTFLSSSSGGANFIATFWMLAIDSDSSKREAWLVAFFFSLNIINFVTVTSNNKQISKVTLVFYIVIYCEDFYF